MSIEPLQRVAALAGIRRLAEDRQRVPGEMLYRLWEEALRASGDATLPLRVARSVRLQDLGVFGFVILTAPTVRAALLAATRYFPLINAAGAWTTRTNEASLELRWTPAEGDRFGIRLSSQSVMAHFVLGANEVIGAGAGLTRAQFRHPSAHNAAAIEELCGCEVRFDTGTNALTFDANGLEHVPPNAHFAMHAFFREQCEAVIGQPTVCVVDHVDRLISRLLPEGDATADRVAAELGMSRRTLHRRLRYRGTSFRLRLGHVRKTIARRLVSESSQPLTDIAFDLGFADLSSLSRAYRTWFGEAPSNHRVTLGSMVSGGHKAFLLGESMIASTRPAKCCVTPSD